MSKVRIKTEIDLLPLLTQLDTNELEKFSREIAKLLSQRKSSNPQKRITDLIRRLNEECVLPEKDLERFYFLRKKREQGELPSKELKELFKLIQKEELLRIERIKILGEIAQLRGVTLNKLNKEFGIKKAKRA